MKSFLDFLKYNNSVPFIFLALLLGASTALATNTQLRQSVFAPETEVSNTVPEKTDVSKLLALNVKTFDLRLRIDTLTEDKGNYYVSYSYQTWGVVEYAWQEMRKVGKMDIPKALLGKRDLKTYLTEQIGQVMDREVAYLGEAQMAAQASATPKQSSQYASLVGSEVKKEDVLSMRQNAVSGNVVKKEPKRASDEALTVETETGLAETVLSKEEIEKIIVAAVATFLAVDTSMPGTIEEPVVTEEEAPATEEVPVVPALEPVIEEEPVEEMPAIPALEPVIEEEPVEEMPVP